MIFLSTLPAWGATVQVVEFFHPVNTFLSTLPAWGATDSCRFKRWHTAFLSTLPAWGATFLYFLQKLTSIYFYPRSPRGERHHYLSTKTADPPFLSTLPAWGATGYVCGVGEWRPISIHAPRVGSDPIVHFPLAVAEQFLSTLPAWGATSLPPTASW